MAVNDKNLQDFLLVTKDNVTPAEPPFASINKLLPRVSCLSILISHVVLFTYYD